MTEGLQMSLDPDVEPTILTALKKQTSLIKFQI